MTTAAAPTAIIEDRKAQAAAWFAALRDRICTAFEAIEDAYVVAACLQKFFTDPAMAFARYEEIRRDRTAAVVRKSHENRKQAFSPALADKDEVAASVVRDWQQVRVKERLDWLYQYDATSVAI